MLRNLVSTLPLCFFMCLLSGCQPVKLYPGPERPQEQLALVFFDSLGASVVSLSVDGISNPHPGRAVALLPGEHRLELRYQERFEDADATITDGAFWSDERKGFGFTRVGSCSLKFSLRAGDTVSVAVDAGSEPLLSAPEPPSITMRPPGFNPPILYRERCSSQGSSFMIQR